MKNNVAKLTCWNWCVWFRLCCCSSYVGCRGRNGFRRSSAFNWLGSIGLVLAGFGGLCSFGLGIALLLEGSLELGLDVVKGAESYCKPWC